MTDKQMALNAIERLSQEAGLEEIRDRIEFLIAIREAEESLERGEFIPHEEVEREFASWIKSRRTQSSGQGKPTGT